MLIKQKFFKFAHKIFTGAAQLFDFRCYNMNLSWFHDKEYLSIWNNFVETNKKIHERRFNLFSFAKSVQNIEGDIAECGVYKGAGSYLMLHANKDKGKTLHIFDSFEGLSDPEEVDAPKRDRAFSWKKNDLSVPEEQVRKNLQEFSNIKYYKGWIPDRFSEVSEKKFSLVHIDVDLYQPTLESVKFFYDRMSVGGLIICDDYGFETCPGARKAMDEFVENKPETVVHLTSGHGIIIKQ